MDVGKESAGLKCRGIVGVLNEPENRSRTVKGCLNDDCVSVEDHAGVRVITSGDRLGRIRERKTEVTEFKEMLKIAHNVKVNSCKSDYSRKKLPCGVRKRENGRWFARAWHPKLKCYFSLGSYDTAEEAEAAFNCKTAEFEKNYGCKNDGAHGCEAAGDDDFQDVEKTPSDKRIRDDYEGRSNSSEKARLKAINAQEPDNGSPDCGLIAERSKLCSTAVSNRPDHEKASAVPKGRKTLNKKFNGSVNCGDHGCDGFIENLEDFPTIVKKTRAGSEASNKSMKKAKLKCIDDSPAKHVSIRPDYEGEKVPIRLQTEVVHFSHSPNEARNIGVVSVSEGKKSNSSKNYGDHGPDDVGGVTENLEVNSTVVKKTRAGSEGRNKTMKKAKLKAIDDASEKSVSIRLDYEVEKVPTRLQTEVVSFSHSSDEARNLDVNVSKGSEISQEFNYIESLSMGIINEYGQLMGEYSSLDEMGLNLPDEAMEVSG